MSAIHGLTHTPVVKVNPELRQVPKATPPKVESAPPKAATVVKPTTTVDKTV